MDDIVEALVPESSGARAPTAVPTSTIAKDGTPKFNLEEQWVIPCVGHEELGLSEPLRDLYHDVRHDNPPKNTHCASSKPLDNDRVPCRGPWTIEDKKCAEIWNWGIAVDEVNQACTLMAKAKYFKSQSEWKLPICQSLLKDLHCALYKRRFDDGQSNSSLIEDLEGLANGFLNHIILRLDDRKLFETGRPISHIFVDIKACIDFLRTKAKCKDDMSREDQKKDFGKSQNDVWEIKYTENWDEFSKRLSDQFNCIFDEVCNILLLDPKKHLTIPDPKDSKIRLPYFRAWSGDQNFRQHSFTRSAHLPTFRGDLYNSAGIKPGEINPKETAKANLADLKANVILNGPFKMALTNDPSLHLRFDETDFQRPTLLLLDSRTIKLLALLDLTGFMADLELPTFLDELLLSHSLFFGRSTISDKVMQSLFKGIDMNIVRDYRDRWSESISAVHISDFPIYGTRLQSIHQRMTDWRPLRLDHAFRFRPYRDSLPFYAFRFALFLGVLAVAALALNIYNTVKSKGKG